MWCWQLCASARSRLLSEQTVTAHSRKTAHATTSSVWCGQPISRLMTMISAHDGKSSYLVTSHKIQYVILPQLTIYNANVLPYMYNTCIIYYPVYTSSCDCGVYFHHSYCNDTTKQVMCEPLENCKYRYSAYLSLSICRVCSTNDSFCIECI